MTPHFEFLTIAELLEDNCNFNREQKEFILDELTQYDGKDGEPVYISTEGIAYDIIKQLEKYAGGYRNKHGSKESCKCQECVISNSLAGLENILLEYVKQIEELQTQLLNYSGTTLGNGMATIGNEITEGIIAKSSIEGSTGLDGLAGGAVGGAGGGLAAGLKNIEKVGGLESKGGVESKGEEKELGPGATGGAAGGALGSAGIPKTGALSEP